MLEGADRLLQVAEGFLVDLDAVAAVFEDVGAGGECEVRGEARAVREAGAC